MSQCNYDIWAITAYSYAYIGVVIPIGTARFDPNIFGGGLIRYGDKTVSRRGIRLLLSRLFERGFQINCELTTYLKRVEKEVER
jgi:hypothetical protein